MQWCTTKPRRKKLMPRSTRVVAELFVRLVKDVKDWKELRELPPHDLQVLLELVQVAGFEALAVVPGRIDGSRVSESWEINPLCRFKVLRLDGEDFYFATGWLDSIVRQTDFMKSGLTQGVDNVMKRIAESQPLTPIQLTPEGDILKELTPEPDMVLHSYLVEHFRDETLISPTRIGYHQFCEGVFSRHRVTTRHDVLLCGKCHLRVRFPTTVNTYGELRTALAPPPPTA